MFGKSPSLPPPSPPPPPETPTVDLAIAYVRLDEDITMALVSGGRQREYTLPRHVAATLVGELARALATGRGRTSSARTDDSGGT